MENRMISKNRMLVAIPASGALPFAVTLRYALSSTAPPEAATVTYELEAFHNVCFQVDGRMAKTLTVTRQVTAADPGSQEIDDDAMLVLCPQGSAVSSLFIGQTISDASGAPPLHDSVQVQIV
jgi:hypothetical protein